MKLKNTTANPIVFEIPAFNISTTATANTDTPVTFRTGDESRTKYTLKYSSGTERQGDLLIWKP